ncbi:GNAT family N-acetyltransferase [Micromonosporaceae bacterium Da 78-11]
MLIDHWPLAGVQIRTDRLELRLADDDELATLADLAAEGVHKPGETPFLTPWTDRPPAARARSVIQGQWFSRGAWTPQDWTLDLTVFENGQPVGVQAVAARDFATLREVSSYSWLGLTHHGRGIGTEMRAAMLHLAFTGLSAEAATTTSFADNPIPLRISHKLGYQPDGITRDVLHGRPAVSERLRLTRTRWNETAHPGITLTGLTPCLALFGAPTPA